jgi:deoxyribonuclease-4
MKRILENIKDIDIWVRPETTGKGTQWGDIDEVIRLSKDFDKVLPCVDFAHLHARSNGEFNTYDEFARILEKMADGIGAYSLENFHGHVAGIAYSEKGEKHHLNLEESDMKYKDLLRAMKVFNVKGVLTCESPNIEDDTKLLKDFYMGL